jgi:hypothetical protein
MTTEVIDNLVGPFPLRIRVDMGSSPPLWRFDNMPEDCYRYRILTEHDRAFPIYMPRRGNDHVPDDSYRFSTWEWDTSTSPVLENLGLRVAATNDISAIAAGRRPTTGTEAQVVAWERLNLQWNMAILHGRKVAVTPLERRCSVLKSVLWHIDIYLNILKEHDQLVAALLLSDSGPLQTKGQSLMANQAFLLAWSAFITSRLQWCSHSYIETTVGTRFNEVSKDLYAGSAAAGAIAMASVLTSLKHVDETLSNMALMIKWKEASEGCEVLFKAVAEYHQSFLSTDQIRLQRLRAVCVHSDAFNAICNRSQTGIGASLQESCRERLEGIVRYAKESIVQAGHATPANDEMIDLPHITTWFYHPDSHGGIHMKKFELTTAVKGHFHDRSLEKQEPTSMKRAPVTTTEDFGLKKTALKPETKPLHLSQLDLVRLCKQARAFHLWVLVVIDSTDASSLALRKVVATNEFITDIISRGFLFCQRQTIEAQPFVADYGVTQFPFVAIFEPHSMKIRWSCSDWGESDSLIAERLADKLLSYNGSYDPYEGLARVINVPEGCEPPTHLVFTAGGFRAALQKAEATNRWMLVNLQSDGALASHCLNRDVWRDETVESIVRENFVFWQKVCFSKPLSTNVAYFSAAARSLTRLMRAKCMPRYSKSRSSRTCRFLTRSADWSCGAKKVGLPKSLSLRRRFLRRFLPYPTLMCGSIRPQTIRSPTLRTIIPTVADHLPSTVCFNPGRDFQWGM